MKDLIASVNDGRYREQKKRLLETGIPRNKIMYLLEGRIDDIPGQMKTLSPQNAYPTDSRSDSIDIINTEINLRITDFTTKIISGNSKITFTPKVNGINKINLDLLSMNEAEQIADLIASRESQMTTLGNLTSVYTEVSEL
jgi:ERCC4-type nuclease